MGDDTYYSLLEVDESASKEEIRAAFRELAREYHPDRIPEHLRSGRIGRDAEEMFKLIVGAHQVLSDPKLRQRYDEELRRHRNTSRGEAEDQEPGPRSSPAHPKPPPAQSSKAYSHQGGHSRASQGPGSGSRGKAAGQAPSQRGYPGPAQKQTSSSPVSKKGRSGVALSALALAIVVALTVFRDRSKPTELKSGASLESAEGEHPVTPLRDARLATSTEPCSLPGIKRQAFLAESALSRNGMLFAACVNSSRKNCTGTFAECRELQLMAWDVGQCRLAHTEPLDAGCFGLAVSNGGEQLVVGDSEKLVHLWDLRSGAEILGIGPFVKEARVMLFSDDRKRLLIGFGYGPPAVTLWDLAENREIATFRGHEDSIQSLAFRPGSATIASSSGGALDYSVRLWDSRSEKELASFRMNGIPFKIAFSPTGDYLATTDGDQVGLIDVVHRRLVRRMDLSHNDHEPIEALSFSLDGSALVGFRSSTVFLWDISTGSQIGTAIDQGYYSYGVAFLDARTFRLVHGSGPVLASTFSF